MIELWGLKLNFYGLILGVSALVAFEVSKRLARQRKINEHVVEKAFYWAIGGGIIGARLYHVIDLWKKYYSYYPIRALYIWEGGLGIWGAVLGGLIGLMIFWHLSKKKFDLLVLFDIGVAGLPLAQAIGRLGNWINGELYGRNGEPLFAYEGGLNLVLFYILMKLSGSKKRGFLSGAYLIGYGVIRMVLENLREEEIIWRLASIPVAIIFSILAVLTGSWLIFRRRS